MAISFSLRGGVLGSEKPALFGRSRGQLLPEGTGR